MTTNITPTDGALPVLRADDPAELLAMARLTMGAVPRDRLILVGVTAQQQCAVLTASPLLDLVHPGGRDELERHLTRMREQGSAGAIAVLLLGDGYEEHGAVTVEDCHALLGPLVLHAAACMLPDPFALHVVWVLAGGQARRLELEIGEDEELESWMGPAVDLAPFDSTEAAAAAVLAGQELVSGRPSPGLADAGTALRLTPSTADVRDLPAMVHEAGSAVRRVRARTPATGGEREVFMTDCELLGRLLSALALDALHWELLALCVEHGEDRTIDRDQLLQTLVEDPSWTPHPDVTAGGSRYSTVADLRAVAEAALSAPDATTRELAWAAWRGLTAVMALLGWWNHRYSTAGELVDELAQREPDATLAPLLATLIDTPIRPAWWPDR